jgi:hypothetical protein
VASLLESTQLPRLRALDLGHNHLGDGVGARLAESPFVARLTALALSGNSIRDPGATALVRSPHVARLEELDLSENAIGPITVRALAESDRLPRLRRLTLGRHIGEEGALALAGSATLRNLEQLELVGTRELSAEAKAALRKAFGKKLKVQRGW